MMDQDGPYRYQPLPPVAEQNRPPPFTRLLLLKPGSAEDPFEAHLELVHIEQAPPYEALSYTWGKPTEQPRDYIWLDGHPLPIKPNLEDALRSLRFPNQARRLWVDALCIDQSNLDERARQVQYMRLVYKHAARVVVWLGLKTSGTHEALQAAERIARLREYTDPARSGADSAPPDSDTLHALVSSMMEDIPESAMTNLDEVFQRPYFTRCWCIQEIVASSWAIAKIEDLEMSFFDLIASSLFLVQLKQEVAVNAPWELWNNILMVRQPNHPVYQTEVQGSLGGFLHLLELTRTFQATDDRDRIFSLLGICDEGINPILALTATASGQVSWRGCLVRRGLKRISDFINEFHPQGTFGTPNALMPDYKRETVEVYCDLARFLLRKTPRVLDVLDHVSHNEEPGTGEYPSWVPKWLEERTCLVFRGVFFTGFYSKGRTDPYLADLHDIPAVAEPVRPRVLSVDGYHVDVVDRMSDVFEFVSGSRLAGFAVIKAWFDLYGLPINPRRGTLYRDGSLLDMAFCKAVLGSFFGASIGSNYSSMMQYGGFSMALDQSLFGSVEEIKQDTLVKDLAENFLAFTTFLAESGAVQESFGDPERDRKLVSFLVGVAVAANHRRVFVTRDGRVGIGPKMMRPGDEVIVLFGERHILCWMEDDIGTILLRVELAESGAGKGRSCSGQDCKSLGLCRELCCLIGREVGTTHGTGEQRGKIPRCRPSTMLWQVEEESRTQSKFMLRAQLTGKLGNEADALW